MVITEIWIIHKSRSKGEDSPEIASQQVIKKTKTQPVKKLNNHRRRILGARRVKERRGAESQKLSE